MFILQLTTHHTGEWLELNASGEIISTQFISDLSDCPKINSNAHFTLLFPGEKLFLTTVKLPKMRASERIKAIPYVLEEKLVSDPENVTVAIGESNNNGECVVAVLEKTMLEAITENCKKANLSPKNAIPDFLAITWKPDTWSIVLKNKMAWVRTGFDHGFATDIANLIFLLQLELKKNQKPSRILCWIDDNSIGHTEFEKLNIPTEFFDEKKQSPFDLISLFERSPIQLLQGKYKPNILSPQLKKHWRYCAMMASAFLVSLLLSQLTEWSYFSYQSHQLKNYIALQYHALFPGITEIIAPHTRTKNLLKQYADAEKSSVFLKLLDIAGKTIAQFPGITLQSFHFDGRQLQLQLQSSTPETLTTYAQRLVSQGLQTNQKIVTTSPNAVVADMIIKY